MLLLYTPCTPISRLYGIHKVVMSIEHHSVGSLAWRHVICGERGEGGEGGEGVGGGRGVRGGWSQGRDPQTVQ